MSLATTWKQYYWDKCAIEYYTIILVIHRLRENKYEQLHQLKKTNQLKPIMRVRFLKYGIRKMSNMFLFSGVSSISNWIVKREKMYRCQREVNYILTQMPSPSSCSWPYHLALPLRFACSHLGVGFPDSCRDIGVGYVFSDVYFKPRLMLIKPPGRARGFEAIFYCGKTV